MAEERETNKVRSVFGKEIDVSAIDGVEVGHLLEVEASLLAFEDGDPEYQYGWLVANDPLTSVKIRRGLWEEVDGRTDPVVCPGAMKDSDGSIRVNELIAVRMPKEKYMKLRAGKEAIALQREVAAQSAYKSRIKDIARRMAPDADANPTITESSVTVRAKGSA